MGVWKRLRCPRGAELLAGADGKVSRRYLNDGWRYSPGADNRPWRRIADVPRPVVAAPAIDEGSSRILVFGGDDGANMTYGKGQCLGILAPKPGQENK